MKPEPLTITTIVGPLLCPCGNNQWYPADDGLIQCTGCGTHYHKPQETEEAEIND